MINKEGQIEIRHPDDSMDIPPYILAWIEGNNFNLKLPQYSHNWTLRFDKRALPELIKYLNYVLEKEKEWELL